MLTLINTITTATACSNGRTYYRNRGMYRCSRCGGTITLSTEEARRYRKYCGCNRVRKQPHGLSKHPLYKVWIGLKQRCVNPNKKEYRHYGGRGITVCPEWNVGFAVFYEWAIAAGWRKGLEIDRINNNGNYEPSNCRFVTRKVQTRNTQRTKLTMSDAQEIRRRSGDGERQVDLAREFNIAPSGIGNIVKHKTWI